MRKLKIKQKPEKIRMYSEKLTNQFWMKKKLGFFVDEFFIH